MVVEDVHWIDPTSQELLDALVPRLPALPFLLVLTYRSDLAAVVYAARGSTPRT